MTTLPSPRGHLMKARSSRSPETFGFTDQVNRMLTSSAIDLSIVSTGSTSASDEMTVSFALTIVPIVTVMGRGARGTSVGTVA